MYIDPSGYIPTPMEAAIMASHIYDATSEDKDKPLLGGWKLNKIIPGSEGLKMGVYSRVKADGTTEYALVNKGTNSWGDVINDVQQPPGYSDDMKDSIKESSYFVANHKYSEITMVGHSKGGAEAIANAVANNKNAITFNPAIPFLEEYGLSNEDYTASATNYVVKDEILNYQFGEEGTGTTVYLPTQHKIKWWYTEFGMVWQMIKNRKMDSVINALKEAGYN
jgi:hypothetical protein